MWCGYRLAGRGRKGGKDIINIDGALYNAVNRLSSELSFIDPVQSLPRGPKMSFCRPVAVDCRLLGPLGGGPDCTPTPKTCESLR